MMLRILTIGMLLLMPTVEHNDDGTTTISNIDLVKLPAKPNIIDGHHIHDGLVAADSDGKITFTQDNYILAHAWTSASDKSDPSRYIVPIMIGPDDLASNEDFIQALEAAINAYTAKLTQTTNVDEEWNVVLNEAKGIMATVTAETERLEQELGPKLDQLNRLKALNAIAKTLLPEPEPVQPD